jgi:hypothetical protein
MQMMDSLFFSAMIALLSPFHCPGSIGDNLGQRGFNPDHIGITIIAHNLFL